MILLCGGIGSGKSVVSAILRANGFEVYDSDIEAKRIMDSDYEIKQRLCAEICSDAVDPSGRIDRPRVAEVVFADADKLAALNAIVHNAVRSDINRRMVTNPQLIVETAIPISSGLTAMADSIWQVEAPESLRIERVMRRNSITAEAVRSRIEAQRTEAVSGAVTIINDGLTPLLPQILQLITI